MKKVVMSLLLMSTFVSAGVVRFAAKESFKAVKFASFPARHPKKDAHAAKRSARFLAKLVF